MSETPHIDQRLVDLLYGELSEGEESALRAEIAADEELTAAWSALVAIEEGLGRPDPVEAPARVRQNVLREARLKLDARKARAPWWASVWLPGGVLAAAAAVGLAVLLPSLSDRHADSTGVSAAPVAIESIDTPEPTVVAMESPADAPTSDGEEPEADTLMAVAPADASGAAERQASPAPRPVQMRSTARSEGPAAAPRRAEPRPPESGLDTGWAPIGSGAGRSSVSAGAGTTGSRGAPVGDSNDTDRPARERMAAEQQARQEESPPALGGAPPGEVAEMAPPQPQPTRQAPASAPAPAAGPALQDDLAYHEEVEAAPRREARSRTSADRPEVREEPVGQATASPQPSTASPQARPSAAAPEAELSGEPSPDERLIRRIERMDRDDSRRPALMLEAAERARNRGDGAAATAWWQRILREHPDSDEADTARERLAR